MVIAIDGPGGVGKSTVTRRVAAARGLDYLDTGATYRAAALAAMRSGVDLRDRDAVIDAVAAATIEYKDGSVYLDGEDVSAEIRTPQVTAASSAVAGIAAVRSVVVAMQRGWVDGRGGDAVVEGRDIGTVVFPDAAVKVFLTARPEIRAARRASDQADGHNEGVAAVRAALDERDRADSTRETSPLRPAEDAHTVDTSDLSLDDVVDAVLDLVDAQRRRPKML